MWFKDRYRPLILSGEKTQTLRARTRLVPGQEVRVSVGPRAPFALLRVLAVDSVAVRALTVEDAHADGFPTRTSLIQEIRRLYPGTSTLWRVRFELLAAL